MGEGTQDPTPLVLTSAEKELRQYADSQIVLVREVNRRVKNNLSAIQYALNVLRIGIQVWKFTMIDLPPATGGFSNDVR
ncbi:MAG: hypothetical protein PVG41_14565 [Desulfobacteraceae bacterium]